MKCLKVSTKTLYLELPILLLLSYKINKTLTFIVTYIAGILPLQLLGF